MILVVATSTSRTSSRLQLGLGTDRRRTRLRVANSGTVRVGIGQWCSHPNLDLSCSPRLALRNETSNGHVELGAENQQSGIRDL